MLLTPIAFGFFVGALSDYFGLTSSDWQFWVFSVPAIAIYGIFYKKPTARE